MLKEIRIALLEADVNVKIVKEFIDKNRFVRYKDDKAMASFLFNGSDFISYDDAESIEEKCRYIEKMGLLGMMYWEHGLDETHELIGAMRCLG